MGVVARAEWCFNPRPHTAGDSTPLNLNRRNYLGHGFREPLCSVDPAYERRIASLSYRLVKEQVTVTANLWGKIPITSGSRKTLGDQRPFRIIGRLGAEMLDAPRPIAAEKIISKTVFLWIDFVLQLRFQGDPHRRIDKTFEY